MSTFEKGKGSPRRRIRSRGRGHQVNPALERFEERLLLSTYDVTSAADDGSVGTLRDAITQLDAVNSPIDLIDFKIGAAGSPQTITLLNARGPLPAITKAVTIDATTQQVAAGAPLI